MPRSMATIAKPDALELFTDRVFEQEVVRRALAPSIVGPIDSQYLITAFYGVGGVGKTTLCRRALEIAEKEFVKATACVHTSFDDQRWSPGASMGAVADELCRALHANGIPPI